MKNYKYHYVYRITNKLLNKHYYGDRSCDCHPSEDLGKKYFSSFSEKWFKQDQKTNSQNYKYKIIRIFETSRQDAKNLEIKLHRKFDVKNNPNFINKANQLTTGFCTSGTSLSETHKKKISIAFKGRKDSDETRKKKSESLKGRKITWGDKLSVARKGVDPWNKNKKFPEFSGENNSFYGKNHKVETLKIISESSKLQWVSFSEEEKLRIGKQRSETAITKESQKEKNNPQSKCYKVTSPTGLEFWCNGSLKRFSTDNNLDSTTMFDLAKGIRPKSKRSKHYGWNVEEINKNTIPPTQWY